MFTQANSGTSGGKECVFPFIYNDVTYTRCTSIDWGRPWCATTDNRDRDNLWAECISKLLIYTANGVLKNIDIPQLTEKHIGLCGTLKLMSTCRIYDNIHHVWQWDN